MSLFKLATIGIGGAIPAALLALQPAHHENPAPPAMISVEEFGSAEGTVLRVDRDGSRIALQDEKPAAQATLMRLFNLAEEPQPAAAENVREFSISSETRLQQPLRVGDTLRVRFRIHAPAQAVEVERIDSTQTRETSLPPPVSESKLAREIRWALREDERLTLKGKLVLVSQDSQGILLEGGVSSEHERQIVEEKAERIANGCPVISRLKIVSSN